MCGELGVSTNLSSASAVLGRVLLPATVGKLRPDKDCLHVHFHCETAGAQHEVATKSATHVIPDWISKAYSVAALCECAVIAGARDFIISAFCICAAAGLCSVAVPSASIYPH